MNSNLERLKLISVLIFLKLFNERWFSYLFSYKYSIHICTYVDQRSTYLATNCTASLLNASDPHKRAATISCNCLCVYG